jgi:hypothetical protein
MPNYAIGPNRESSPGKRRKRKAERGEEEAENA